MPETPRLHRRRRRRAPQPRRAGRPDRAAPGRQRDRGHGGDGRFHRGGLPAHERHRRRRVLAGARGAGAGCAASRPAARPGASPRSSATARRNSTRSPRAARTRMVTVAGAVGGWRLALDLARALGGRLPLETLLADAIKQAREACRSRLPRRATCPGTRHAPRRTELFEDLLKDGKPYPAARPGPPAPRRHPGAAGPCGAGRLLPGRYRPRDRRRSGTPRRTGDAGGSRSLRGGRAGAPCRSAAANATLLQLPAADPGARGPADPGHLRPAERRRAGDHRPLSRSDRGDEARLRDPRPGGHRTSVACGRPPRLPDAGAPRPGSRADR